MTPPILEPSDLAPASAMVILSTVPEPPLVDVVLLVEDTALGGLHLQELMTQYVIPALEHFSWGPASDLDFASLKCSSSFSVVPFYASDCPPLPPSKIVGPFTSTKKVLNVLDKLELRGGKGERHSSGQEGLANALQLFKEVRIFQFNFLQRIRKNLLRLSRGAERTWPPLVTSSTFVTPPSTTCP